MLLKVFSLSDATQAWCKHGASPGLVPFTTCLQQHNLKTPQMHNMVFVGRSTYKYEFKTPWKKVS